MGHIDSHVDNIAIAAANRAEMARRTRAEAGRREAAARDQNRADLRATIEANSDLFYRGFSVDAAQRLIAAYERMYRVTITWTSTTPAAAVIGVRHIYAPAVRTPEDLATVLHELAHIVNGPCPGRAPHRDHQYVASDGALVRSCVACETAASLKALSLAPCSREMQDLLARCLESYLTRTSAPLAAQREARRFVGGAAWRVALLRRLEHQQRMDKYREVMRWL